MTFQNEQMNEGVSRFANEIKLFVGILWMMGVGW